MQFTANIGGKACLSGKESATLSNLFALAVRQSLSAASRLTEFESEMDKAVDRASKLGAENEKMTAKSSFLKERVNELRVDIGFISDKIVVVGAHRDKFNDELASRKAEAGCSRATLAGKPDVVELLKRGIAEKEALFVRER